MVTLRIYVRQAVERAPSPPEALAPHLHQSVLEEFAKRPRTGGLAQRAYCIEHFEVRKSSLLLNVVKCRERQIQHPGVPTQGEPEFLDKTPCDHPKVLLPLFVYLEAHYLGTRERDILTVHTVSNQLDF